MDNLEATGYRIRRVFTKLGPFQPLPTLLKTAGEMLLIPIAAPHSGRLA